MEDIKQEEQVKIEFTPDQHKEIDRIVNKHLTAKELEFKAQSEAKEKEIEDYKTKLVELSNLNEKISKLEKAAEVFGAKVEVAKPIEVKKTD